MRDMTLHLYVLDSKEIKGEILGILMLEDESIILSCKGDGYKVAFTNKRILLIAADSKSDLRSEITILPYSRIQSFSVISDSMISVAPQDKPTVVVRFTDGCVMRFEFQETVCVKTVLKMMGKCIMA